MPTASAESEQAVDQSPAIVPLNSTMVEFLEYVALLRTYERTMEAWRSSCPRLTIWEDALVGGLVEVRRGEPGALERVHLTTAGLLALRDARRERALRQAKYTQGREAR